MAWALLLPLGFQIPREPKIIADIAGLTVALQRVVEALGCQGRFAVGGATRQAHGGTNDHKQQASFHTQGQRCNWLRNGWLTLGPPAPAKPRAPPTTTGSRHLFMRGVSFVAG